MAAKDIRNQELEHQLEFQKERNSKDKNVIKNLQNKIGLQGAELRAVKASYSRIGTLEFKTRTEIVEVKTCSVEFHDRS